MVRIFRQGERFEAMPDGAFGPFSGVEAGPRGAGQAFDWPPYDLRVPSDWPPGCYVALLAEGGADRAPSPPLDESTPDGRFGRALFVVRASPSGERAPILYKLPTFTYHAYNVSDPAYASSERERRADGLDGQTFYTGAAVVSLQRNGCGTGGTPWDAAHAPDVYDLATPRQTFAHWDAKFIAWMERCGYRAEFCTDLDLHECSVDELLRHNLIVCAGHDEYWSDVMRANIEGYIERGGNVAFFGGNLLWWRVRVFDGNRTIERAGHFHDESALTGATYGHGGGYWVGDRPATGFTVRNSAHWAFEGTGLHQGSTFGAARHLVGYEADGQSFSWPALLHEDRLEYDDANPLPKGFELLAYADIRAWKPDPARGEILGNGAAALGIYERGGTVFTAATTDWPRVLAEGDPTVERITRNVFDRLSRPRSP